MDQLITSLADLLRPLAVCFRPEVFLTFGRLVAAAIVCLGPHSVSRLWQTTGRAGAHDHSPPYRLFGQAVWNWDEVARVLLAQLLAAFVPGTRLWVVLDDTLCHKRGAKVACGGIFLDAVLSTKKHKTFRFGTNWVTLGLVVQLPFRPDRFFCLPLLWRVYSKKGQPGHRTKTALARELLDLLCDWLPGRRVTAVADSAYVGRVLLRGRPGNLDVVGPIHPRAVLTAPLPAGHKGRRRKGPKVTTPAEAAAGDRWPWQEITLEYPGGRKRLLVKRLTGVCWYAAAGPAAVQVVLVRDPAGQWRDERLLCTDPGLTAAEVVAGYLRRWSVEVAYCESKQLLGLHDPQVWKAESVARAHPLAWFVGTLVVLWYARVGRDLEAARWQRPWYRQKAGVTFADMLACCRLHLWRHWLADAAKGREEKLEWLLHYLATAQ